jgi:TetR/AcrR family transcriptional repressor of nem operon
VAQHLLLTAAARTPCLGRLLRLAEPEAGTMLVHGSHPAIRRACAASIPGHASMLEPDIAEAVETRRIEADWTPARLARHTHAVLQGAFIAATATGDRALALESVDHLECYLTLLFTRPPTERKPT